MFLSPHFRPLIHVSPLCQQFPAVNILAKSKMSMRSFIFCPDTRHDSIRDQAEHLSACGNSPQSRPRTASTSRKEVFKRLRLYFISICFGSKYAPTQHTPISLPPIKKKKTKQNVPGAGTGEYYVGRHMCGCMENLKPLKSRHTAAVTASFARLCTATPVLFVTAAPPWL